MKYTQENIAARKKRIFDGLYQEYLVCLAMPRGQSIAAAHDKATERAMLATERIYASLNNAKDFFWNKADA